MSILEKIKKGKKAAEPKAAAAKPEKTEKAVQSSVPKSALRAHRVLIRPLLSEKTSDQESHGQYAFEVDARATKVDIKNAVNAVYGVMPKKVNVLQYEGKKVRFGRSFGHRRNRKKTIVLLPKGKTMSIHEGV